MATTKKSRKPTGGKKKRGSAKRPTARKRATKAATKRRTKRAAPTTAALKRKARQGLRAAQGGMDTVREAGERTWEALKSTTAQMVEGVKERLGDSDKESRERPTYP
jgi:hypothetical protein